MKNERDDIKHLNGIEAVRLMDDPSLINSKSDVNRKKLKSFVTGKISKMIHSATLQKSGIADSLSSKLYNMHICYVKIMYNFYFLLCF